MLLRRRQIGRVLAGKGALEERVGVRGWKGTLRRRELYRERVLR